MIGLLSLNSCRQDLTPDQENYKNSGAFHLTSKRISFSESKHKAKVIPELEKAEVGIEAISKKNAQGKTVNFGNGMTINTDDVIYMENGPNYHTYTFNIKRENALADAPLENLLLVPLPDGTYKEFLIEYNLTAQKKQKIIAGIGVNTNGKTQITELAKGSFNSVGQLARLVCGEVSETIWVECS